VCHPDTFMESMKLEKLMKPVKPVYHFITDRNTDEGIIRFAEKNNLDLLIVMPKQRSFFESLIHKSFTKQCEVSRRGGQKRGEAHTEFRFILLTSRAVRGLRPMSSNPPSWKVVVEFLSQVYF